MRVFLLASLMLLLSGCATVHVQTADCQATYSTVLKDIDAAQFSICGGTADVVQSSVNLDALKALSAAIGALAK